jgi:hypothetical protein
VPEVGQELPCDAGHAPIVAMQAGAGQATLLEFAGLPGRSLGFALRDGRCA